MSSLIAGVPRRAKSEKRFAFDPEVLNRLTSLVGAWEYKDANDTLERQFQDAGLDLQHPQIRKFCELCLRFQDLPRHLGQHSGGMVVCQGQLDSVVPLEPATMPGRVVVQWDKDDCADMGIVKVDLLGLGMMAVLEDSLKIIRDDYGEAGGRVPARGEGDRPPVDPGRHRDVLRRLARRSQAARGPGGTTFSNPPLLGEIGGFG